MQPSEVSGSINQQRMNTPPRSVPLNELHFDLENPRYGRRSAFVNSETDALNMIVDEFGVDDLLQSIVTNGFFSGEPLIVKPRDEGGFKVLEGNRRLAALLIISEDTRAADQKRRCNVFSKKSGEMGHQVPVDAPVLVIEDQESLREVLAYLGTKHIVGASEWDSYAKARWIAEMKASSDLTLRQIKEMIGDVSGFVDRILESYYVVEQLRREGRFEPEQSYIGGRGSNPEFPFSWVYTALNLANVRRFIGIQEHRDPVESLIAPERVSDASDLMLMMFGHKASEREPVIDESRNIADLARALADPVKSALLREGEKLTVVEEKTKPMGHRLQVLLDTALESLSKANGLASQGNLSAGDATGLIMPARSVFQAAKSMRDALQKAINGEDE